MIAMLLFLAANYTATPTAGNRFTLEVEKTGVMKGKKHVFSFPKYTGSLQYDPQSATTSKVEFTLNAASMICEDQWLKEIDVKKVLEWGLDKMIDVQKYPEIHFVSSKVEQSDAGHFQVMGSLTMRGLAHPAVVAVTSNGLVFDGTSTVNMKDWGMKPPTAALGAVGTKPEMLVRFHLLFTQAKYLAR